MNSRRILYVGQLNPSETSYHRMLTIRELGHDVSTLDTLEFKTGGGLIGNAIRFRLCIGPSIAALNRAFVKTVRERKPELIWIDKGVWVWPSSLSAARAAATDAKIVHYNPDDPFGHNRQGWRLFLKTLPLYDVHVVPRDVNIPEYLQAGAKRVVRFNWAFDPAIHRPMLLDPQEKERLGGAVGFVGHFERNRAESVYSLARGGIPVRTWGPGWEKFKFSHSLLRIEQQYVVAADYAKTICAFDINLGFLRKANRDLSTQRSVEIPACGAFMLAERTTEHLALFKEGEEAEFFGSDAELLEKVKFYLANPEKRAAVAARGRERCLTSGYSNAERVAATLESLQLGI